MNTIENIIKDQIRQSGPMDVGTFMGLALGHPTHGYYITRDPLGAEGDFTTAPEISQIFGEMISVCIIEAWIRGGSPNVHLVELGPGRGTLMADIMRCCKNAMSFFERMTLHLVETSPVLRAKQEEKLAGFKPHWHDSIDTLPHDAPLFILANEFFDALPIRQAIMTTRGWQERVVALEGDQFVFTSRALRMALPPCAPDSFLEFSPVRDKVMSDIAVRLQKQGGMMLAIDYGHGIENAMGDTFQAVHKHKYVSPLEHVGNADLTSHVDFAKLARIATQTGCDVYGPVTQKFYLEKMGILGRLANLQKANPDDSTLAPGVARLIDGADMGTLFKVLAVTGNVSFCNFKPAGFE